MNELEQYFRQNNKNLINKWIHYFDIYDRHFARYKGKEVTILEIGVSHGGSLQMWKQYFGGNAKIYGIDINPECKKLEEENIKIFIGSQADRSFLRDIIKSIPPIDIIIEDGGHMMNQQIITFKELFDYVKDDGVYLSEDLHTSYWVKFGGGHKRRGTFIEYSKNLIDALNAHHTEQNSLKVSRFTNSADSIHYYDSVIVIEKRKKGKPYCEMFGKETFTETNPKQSIAAKLAFKYNNSLIKRINKLLRYFRLPSFIWK